MHKKLDTKVPLASEKPEQEHRKSMHQEWTAQTYTNKAQGVNLLVCTKRKAMREGAEQEGCRCLPLHRKQDGHYLNKFTRPRRHRTNAERMLPQGENV